MERQFTIYAGLAAFALYLGVLVGCTADDTPGGDLSGEVMPVTISLRTEEPGLLTKAVDEDAFETLDVYIYSGSAVEKHLTDADFTNNVATVELTTGRKTIRAVANTGRATDVGEFDACTWIDEHGQMPMSTTKDTAWTVSPSQSRYEVRLNRMVAKMNVRIEDDREEKTDIGAITIGNLLQARTPVYRSKYGVVALPGVGNNWTGEGMSGGEYFYLHENSGSFPVSVVVGSDTRAGRMEAKIPRNHIFPLVIHITDYSLLIEAKYSLAAIGTLPVEKTWNTYSFALPEGCTFKVTVTPKKAKGDWVNATWSVGEPENANSSIVLNDPWITAAGKAITESYRFSGMVSAIHPGDGKCSIPIRLTDGGKEVMFTLEMSTRELRDDELTTKSNSVPAGTGALHIDL